MLKHHLYSYVLLCSAFYAEQAHAQAAFISTGTPSSETLLGISFADTLTGYVCGNNGTLLKTINGGKVWTSLSSGTVENLWDIEVMPGSGGEKIIVVGDKNTVLKSSDGGKSWYAQSIPFQNGSFVFGIQCRDSLNCFACGGDYASFSGAVLRTENGGKTWSKTAVAGSVFLDKIFMLDDENGFTVGTNTSFSDGSIHRITKGNTYSLVKTAASIITNIWCKNAKDIVAVGLTGQIWHSVDSGKTWISRSYNSEDLYGIWFIDDLHGYACGGSSTSSIILYTSDGGDTWQPVACDADSYLQGMTASKDHVFMSGGKGTVVYGTHYTGIGAAISNSGILVFPNPASTKLYIQSENIVPRQIIIFDMTGRDMLTAPISSQSEIDVQAFAAGLYHYRITDGSIILQTGIITID